MKTKLFIFDMGEVLVLNGENMNELADYLKVDVERLQKDYDRYEYPMMEGYMDTECYMEHLENEFGVKLKDNIFRSVYSPYTNKAILPSLKLIKDNGIRCVVGSNTFGPHVDVVERLPERPFSYFDRLYFSHEMRLTKPTVKFFSYILEREGISGEEAFFVDDRSANLIAAGSLGIRTFLYRVDRSDELYDEIRRIINE